MSDDSTTRPRSSRKGRQARIKARLDAEVAQSASAPAFITRRFSPMQLLDETGLALIEENADRILADIGMEFRGDAEVLEIFKTAGCSIDGERVRFDPGFCRSVIQATAPRDFIQHARNPTRSVHIGGNSSLFCPTHCPPFVHDMDKGRRYGTIDDFRNFVRLHQMLPSVHHSGGVLVEPVDIPVPERHIEMIHAHLTLGDKPFMGAVTSAERAEDTVEMARIVFGRNFVEQNCCVYSVINPNAPLVLDTTMVAALKVYARSNQAVAVSSFSLHGAMSPITVAGTLAQLLAEVLAGLSLVQLIRPGAPCTFGMFSSPVCMQTGAPTLSTPEGMQIQMAAAALARRLGVPFHSTGAATTAKVPDSQAGYESAAQLFCALMAGVNFIIHATGSLEGFMTVSYEKTVIDADRCGALIKFAEGFDLSEQSQALSAIREVGPGEHFLGAAHTQALFETANYRARLSDNNTFEKWSTDGAKWQHERANQRFKHLLKTYQPPPMSADIRDGLEAYRSTRLERIRKNGK